MMTGKLPHGFGLTLLAFIPKTDPGSIALPVPVAASDTRPLGLQDSDGKSILSLLSSALATAASSVCSAAQRCLQGRNMTENLMIVESFPMKRIQCCDDDDIVCCFSFDQRTAFPSVSRDWVLRRLRADELSEEIVVMIEALYRDVLLVIRRRNAEERSFPMEIGLNQGCTLSMNIWALILSHCLSSLLFASHQSSIGARHMLMT